MEREDINALIVKPFSWEKVIQLSERHRLLLMFYKKISENVLIPTFQPPPSLKEKYSVKTMQVLGLATEGVRLSTRFDQAGIANILLKGPFLALQIYNDAAMRPSRDIDILVFPNDVETARSILVQEGYRKVYPDFELSTKQQNFYQKHKNQYAFRNPENGCLVELHWRLFSQEELFPVSTERVFAQRQEIVLAGKPVYVLSKKHCIEYLCLHGSLHQWFRLHWLRDIAQLISDQKDDIGFIVESARKNGNERSVEQAIVLSNLFFGSPMLPSNINTNRVVNKLVNQSADAAILDESHFLSKGIERLRLPFYKMRLKKGFGYRLSCWTILQPNFSDWKDVKLPESMFFLYFFLRPFMWFYKTYIKKVK